MIYFNYYKDAKEAYDTPGFVYADIPKGIIEEEDLIKCYSDLKWIAPYFGGNINALDEVLRDVVFYPASKNKIIHHDIPTLSKGDWVGNYLALLNRAIQYLALHRELKHKNSPPYAADLDVYFPIEYKSEVERLMIPYQDRDIKQEALADTVIRDAIINWGKNEIASGEWKKWRESVGLSVDILSENSN